LTAGEGINLTKISSLVENLNIAFKGAEKSGAFELPGDIARCWLTLPNPNGRPNSDIVKPWANGQDIAKRPSDTWIVDFGVDMSVADASLYEKPFEHVLLNVKAEREKNNDRGRRENWWRFGRNGADMRPDSRLCVISRADDTTFGLLSSRQHLVWALANASMHGVGNDPTYNNASCFETFPFPPSLTPRDTAPVAGQASPPCLAGRIVAEAIAAARRLHELREAWLNPAEWVDWVITPEEERAGFPQRPVAKPGFDADLKKRTLTNLYNTRPAWLDLAHKALDQAVAVAYGWPDYTPEMPDEEILRRLLALNLERSQP
jgi:hypothetical protein